MFSTVGGIRNINQVGEMLKFPLLLN